MAGRRKVRGRARILLTGATGNWGRATLKAFAQEVAHFEVIAFVQPTPDSRRILRSFGNMENLRVLFGDLTDPQAVARAVQGADYVLHLGAVVPPLADEFPELTRRVNVGGALNIIRAVRALPDPDAVGVVMVGSVAEYGDRNPPRHWGRVGDPVRASVFDEYALSKIEAERNLVDSGLNRFVWLRQTGIFYPEVIGVRDPIMTHVPFEGVLEWVAAHDAARLLVGICGPGVPPGFWGGVYNVGGGGDWRLTNWEFLERSMRALGVHDLRRVFDRQWFATRNFHGMWYTDSDHLNDLVPFRSMTFADSLAAAVRVQRPHIKLARFIAPRVLRRFVMRPLAYGERGMMTAITSDNEARISAFFGSRAAWEAIAGWADFAPPEPELTPSYLDHGYDADRGPSQWTASDLRDAAHFRGGDLLDDEYRTGGFGARVEWRCGQGHRFKASPRLILGAGHWCPVCTADTTGYRRQAERNAFLAQVEE